MMISETKGSLTVEAFLIMPVVMILLALFIRWGLMLRNDIQDADQDRRGVKVDASGWVENAAGGDTFLYGGPPARRIRDADYLIDLGYSIKEKLPSWFPK
jgi:hypothetical protein